MTKGLSMYQEMNDQMTTGTPVAMVAGTERARYILKVYALMTAGLAAYFASVGIPLFAAFAGNEAAASFCNFFIGMPPLVNFLLLLGGSWLAHSVSMTRGINVIAFFGFAALWGFISIGLVGYAVNVGGLVILAQALGLTVVVMGSLTAYAFISRTDFSFMGGFLFAGLMVVIGGVLLGIVMDMMGYPTSTLSLGITIASTLLFMGYVLYDTSNIIHRYSTDMVVPAAMALMIDFIILFRNILFLLLNRR